MNVPMTRFKLVALLLVSTIFVLVRSLPVIAVASGAIMVLTLVQTGRFHTKTRLLTIIGITCFVLLFQLLFHTGVSIQERLIEGAMASLRIISLSLLVFLFSETTSLSSLASSISFMPRDVRLMITISLALLPAILYEFSIIRMVQETRGYQPRAINVFRSFFPVIIPLLNRTLSRAEHIAIVLQTRGFEE